MGRKKILISNDDGINAKGILELIEIGKEFGDVIVVAPNGPRSAMSMALTVETPVRLTIHENKPEFQSYSCTGTPVDCIKIAFDKLLDKEPDLILSGINHGSNSSISIHYSGTMGAVIEGCIHEIPSIGFSLCDYMPDADFSQAKEYVRRIISSTLENGLPRGTCLNVNIPKGIPNGISICRQGTGKWVNEFEERKDPHNRSYYWITGYFKSMDNGSYDTDNHVLTEDMVSIVPIKTDMTDHQFIENLKNWKI
ncbi:MAG: 5'/3'-nucleotidase SurE [Prolixibacteraceae bacterium]|nr:5'/3'-nucleotidase SurE [Prolixibacteraceae bacterium]